MCILQQHKKYSIRKIYKEVACVLIQIFALKEKSENFTNVFSITEKCNFAIKLSLLKTQQESKLLGHKSLTKNVGWWALIKPNLIHKSPGQTGKKFAQRQKDAAVIWFAFCNLVQQSDFHSNRYNSSQIFFELSKEWINQTCHATVS